MEQSRWLPLDHKQPFDRAYQGFTVFSGMSSWLIRLRHESQAPEHFKRYGEAVLAGDE
jgi:hypothetical protein